MGTLDQDKPVARTAGLLCRDFSEGEIMVYDTERRRAHTLNRTAHLIWRRCDGQTSVAELATRLQQELNTPAAEEVVRLGLDSLRRAHLLEAAAGPQSAGI